MDLHDFYYDLPEELIAQDPLSDRSSSRLMVLDKNTGAIEHKIFRDITEYLKPGDCLVINDTKVIPARLIGEKEGTGAAIEVLLLKRLEDRQDTWEVLVKPGKKCKVGARIVFGGGKLTGEIIDIVEEGNRLIQFSYDGIFEEILDELGQMPLPPYITHKLEDKNRYQTVYAKHEGSAAAPTAGLHFTKELLKQIEDMGVKIARVTLHVGLGTFRPVKVENILDHHMQMRDIQKLIPAEAIVYGRLPLMITENCLVQNETGCHLSEAGDAVPQQAPCRKPNDLQDRTGAKFPLLPAYGHRTEIQNSTPVWLADKPEWKHCGLTYARLRFTTEAPAECADIFRAYQTGAPASGPFTRGLANPTTASTPSSPSQTPTDRSRR